MMRKTNRTAAPAAHQTQRGTRGRVAEYDVVWLTLGFHLDWLTEASTFVRTKDKFEGAQIVFSGGLRLAFSDQSLDEVSVTVDDTGMNQRVAGIGPGVHSAGDNAVIWSLLRRSRESKNREQALWIRGRPQSARMLPGIALAPIDWHS